MKEHTDILFISDIRNISTDMSQNEIETRIKCEMDMQSSWHKIIRPNASMLKFRLPYDPGSTLYLKGDVR